MSEEQVDKVLKSAVIAKRFLKVAFRGRKQMLVWLMTHPEFTQVTIHENEISVPLDEEDRERYAWLIRRAGGVPFEKGDDDKPTPPSGPRGGGTPPSGGTPSGGTVGEYLDTVAIAA